MPHIPTMRDVREFRDQAEQHRQTAGTIYLADVRDRYLAWAASLDSRADVMEKEVERLAAEARERREAAIRSGLAVEDTSVGEDGDQMQDPGQGQHEFGADRI